MSLQDILQKILDEAKLEISQIQKKLEQEKQELFEKFEEEKSNELKELSLKKEEAIKKVSNKVEAMARRELKQKMLTVKHKIITRSLNSFVEYLSKLPDDKYEEILKKLFANITAKNGEILVPSAKQELFKKVIPQGFKIKVDKSVKSGFIAKLEKAEIDNTFENLVLSEFYNEIRSFFAEKLNLI